MIYAHRGTGALLDLFDADTGFSNYPTHHIRWHIYYVVRLLVRSDVWRLETRISTLLLRGFVFVHLSQIKELHIAARSKEMYVFSNSSCQNQHNVHPPIPSLQRKLIILQYKGSAQQTSIIILLSYIGKLFQIRGYKCRQDPWVRNSRRQNYRALSKQNNKQTLISARSTHKSTNCNPTAQRIRVLMQKTLPRV